MSGSPLVSDRFRTVAFATALSLAAAACATEPTGPDDPDPPSNQTPVAQAAAPPMVSATLPVTVDGSGSTDADGDALTYSWSFASTPAGSQAAFADETAVSTSFTPDLPGTYTANLVVSDGEAASTAASVTITAEDNTATMTIGAAGGSIESSDGVVTLEVPAAALTEDTEISITTISGAQMPDAFADMGAEVIAYEMRPDGLQFASPAMIDIGLPADRAPEAGASSFSSTLGGVFLLSDGALSLPNGQATTLDAEAGTARASAEIEHFSSVAWAEIEVDDGAGSTETIRIEPDLPPTIQVDLPFVATIDLSPALDGMSADFVFVTAPDLRIRKIGTATGFQEAEGDLTHFGSYECLLDGQAAWGGIATVEGYAPAGSTVNGVTPTGDPTPIDVTLRSYTSCTAPEAPFQGYDLAEVEALTNAAGEFEPTSYVLAAGQGTVLLSDRDGNARSRFVTDGTFQADLMFAAAGIPSGGLIAISNSGIFVGAEDLGSASGDNTLYKMIDHDGGITDQVGPSGPRRADGPARAVPDVDAHATDVFTAPDGTGGQQIVVVLFGDQNISFFEPRDGETGFQGRTDLVEAFKDDQGSVFGTELPVTAWVGPNGFTESDPMLVVTVTDDVDRASTLWRADLVAGEAVLTEVTNIFPAAEARRLRCLNGICALSSYGSPFGFGNVIFFSWDGQDGITPIQGLSQRTIGVDLIESGAGSVFIATTSFDSNAYTVFEIADDGEFLDSWFNPVPDGCTGPGHVLFRSPSEVLLSCNTSGNVVSSRPFDGE